jgi:hypothetical protein
MYLIRIGLFCLLLPVFVFAQTGKEIFGLKSQYSLKEKDDGIVQSTPFDNGNRLLLIGRNEVQIWDVPNASLVKSYGHNIDGFMGSFLHMMAFYPEQVKVSPNGTNGIVLKKGLPGVSGITIRGAVVWDLRNGERLAILTRPESVRSAVYSTDGSTIMTVPGHLKRSEVAFWDARTFAFRTSISVKDLGLCRLTADGEKVFIGPAKAKKPLGLFVAGFEPIQGIGMWNTGTGKLEKTFVDGDIKLRDGWSADPVLSEDANYLAAASTGNKIVVWETGADGPVKYEIKESDPKKMLRLQGVTKDSKYLLATRAAYGEVYELSTGRLYRRFSLLSPNYIFYRLANPDQVVLPADSGFQLSPDNRYAVIYHTGAYIVYDFVNEKELHTLPVPITGYEHGMKTVSYSAEFAVVSPDSKYLLIFGTRTIRVHDIATGELVQSLFDPNRAQYGKDGVLRDNGLKNEFAGWLASGDSIYVYGEDGKSFYLWSRK